VYRITPFTRGYIRGDWYNGGFEKMGDILMVIGALFVAWVLYEVLDMLG
jgi:hypothetical protein